MKQKIAWQPFDVENLSSKNESERFDYFYNVACDSAGNFMFVGQLLQRGAALFPDTPALIYQDRIISYQELYHRSLLLSKKLIGHGVKPGDRVLLFFSNSLAFYICRVR